MSTANPPPGTQADIPTLPADVLDALAQGNAIEAIKRLRNATGLGLKEAKEAVAAHQQGRAPSLPPTREAVLAHVPPPVLAALQRGQKIEAIRLLREHTGLGLKEAKEAVEAMPQASSLAPGETQRTGWMNACIVALVVALALAWWWLRGT